MASDPKVRSLIEQHIEEQNGKLARYEQIKRITILANDFTIETGELTPTLKMKRKVVNEKYKDLIESMYAGT